MNIHHVLIFCCSSALSVFLDARMIFRKTEGEDFKHNFTVNEAEGGRKYLCRNNCKKEDILIETQGKRARSGRYIIRYDGVLNVVITELTKSDTGRYRFGVSNSSSPGSFQDFEIQVRDLCEGGVIFGEQRVYSSPEGGNVTIRCSVSAAERNRKFLCKKDCKNVVIETIDVATKSGRYSIEYGSSRFFNVTIEHLTKSDSGRYRCGVGRQLSENTCQEFEIIVTDGYTLPLVVCLVVIVLLVVSLILYKWKTGSSADLNCWRRPTGRNMEFGISAPGPTPEDPTYENLNSPTYATLDQHNTGHDSMYETLGEQI